MGNSRFRGAVLLALLLSAPVVWAGGDPNVCDAPGDAPDVIVGDLHQVNSYGSVGDIYAYSVGTTSCNIGTCWLNWISETADHPVIGQNMFRFKDGRIEQIGQSWLKHGFFALSGTVCSTSCIGTNGDHLGVNCSDPYSAGLNGSQSRLGPRSEVNPSTGVFPFPFGTDGQTGDAIYKRLQVHSDDLDPALNPGALYFVEGQYVSADDAQAGNGGNNNSFRPISVNPSTFQISLTGTTARQKAGVDIWGTQVANLKASGINIVNDGEFRIAGVATDNGDGTYHFEYAIQNISSDRSAQAFRVPVPDNSTVTNIGFHDVDYHSGEPYDNTDWVMFYDPDSDQVIWEGQPYDVNINANALRWGTMYNFWFDVDATSLLLGSVTLDLFKPGQPGDPDSASVIIVSPNPCNNNGICEPAENCSNCVNDCITTGGTIGFCGDGICEEALNEDCLSCVSDCAGMQGGNPGDRYCCGSGGGTNPIPCTDSRCNAGGFTCGTTGEEFCCGDASCDVTEDSCVCAADCGRPPARELICDDAFDNDCDGNTDCNDRDCCTDAGCFTGVDNDVDGVADCDCNDNDASVWDSPGEVPALTISKTGGSGALLNWVSPVIPGANLVNYEALRSGDPANFVFGTVCLADTDPGDLTNLDTEVPVLGTLYQYLIRATNNCPGADGIGTIGTDSDANLRPGAVCP
jgi:hypothetical protein